MCIRTPYEGIFRLLENEKVCLNNHSSKISGSIVALKLRKNQAVKQLELACQLAMILMPYAMPACHLPNL